jgi:DNA (cytosine-5)-methyltransferase 1
MQKLRILDLFSGIGGFSLGLERAGGFETVAFCEIDPHGRRVLAKHWPEVPCYDDVSTLTFDRLRADGIARVDVICGGFPCQDASFGQTQWGRRVGTEGQRTGLYRHVIRLADEIRPSAILLENVPGLLSAGFGHVLGDLAALGYDAEWDCIPACLVGLPHRRDRVWIAAYPSGSGLSRSFAHISLFERARKALPQLGDGPAHEWRALERRIRGVRGGDGVSLVMERRRLKQAGNAVVPQIPEAIGITIAKAISNIQEAA